MKSKILLSFVLVFAFFLCGCNTDEDMQAQYDLGYEKGYEQGKSDGRAEAWDEFVQALEDEPMDEVSVNDTGLTADKYYVNTEQTPLNMRLMPQKDSEIIGQIPKGANIDVYYIENGFGYAFYNGAEGWVNLDYCEKGTNPNPPTEYTSDTVFITDTGKKYHEGWCQHLHSSKIPVTLDEALSRGLEPCKTCH